MKDSLNILLKIIKEKKYFWILIISTLIYIFLYLFAIEQIVIGASFKTEGFSFKLIENWPSLIFKQRTTFLYEPIIVLSFGTIVTFFLSIPNLLLAMLLGLLVGLNITVSYYSFKKLALKGVKGFAALLGTLPAIISGTACCVPTLILVIGLQLTATLVTVWSFFLPLSLILLVVGLFWSLNRIKKNKF